MSGLESLIPDGLTTPSNRWTIDDVLKYGIDIFTATLVVFTFYLFGLTISQVYSQIMKWLFVVKYPKFAYVSYEFTEKGEESESLTSSSSSQGSSTMTTAASMTYFRDFEVPLMSEFTENLHSNSFLFFNGSQFHDVHDGFKAQDYGVYSSLNGEQYEESSSTIIEIKDNEEGGDNESSDNEDNERNDILELKAGLNKNQRRQGKLSVKQPTKQKRPWITLNAGRLTFHEYCTKIVFTAIGILLGLKIIGVDPWKILLTLLLASYLKAIGLESPVPDIISGFLIRFTNDVRVGDIIGVTQRIGRVMVIGITHIYFQDVAKALEKVTEKVNHGHIPNPRNIREVMTIGANRKMGDNNNNNSSYRGVFTPSRLNSTSTITQQQHKREEPVLLRQFEIVASFKVPNSLINKQIITYYNMKNTIKKARKIE